MCKLVSDLLPQQSTVIFALTPVVPFLINTHESYFHLLQECFHVSLYTLKKKTTKNSYVAQAVLEFILYGWRCS